MMEVVSAAVNVVTAWQTVLMALMNHRRPGVYPLLVCRPVSRTVCLCLLYFCSVCLFVCLFVCLSTDVHLSVSTRCHLKQLWTCVSETVYRRGQCTVTFGRDPCHRCTHPYTNTYTPTPPHTYTPTHTHPHTHTHAHTHTYLPFSFTAPCGLRGCNNRPTAFPGQMSYKVTKPGLVCVL